MMKNKTNMIIYKWNPLEEKTIEKLYINNIFDDIDTLTLKLTDDKNYDISVKFDSHITYRISNVSERLKTLGKYKILIGHWGFYTATNSDFLNWIVEESLNIREISEFKHYIIISEFEEVIEIISCDAPIVLITPR